MDDEHSHHAYSHLHHLVRMGVVHEGPVLAEREFVDVGLPRPDVGLGQSAHAIHAVGEKDTVPVDRGVFWKLVGDPSA